MPIHGTTRLLGLIGHPVAHSYSPAMHNAALEKMGLDLAYVPLDVKLDQLAHCLQGLRAMGFVGANVTLPHKQAVLPLLDEISDLSCMLGAVNTIIVGGDGKLRGDTTDPAGFIAGFRGAGHDFDGRSVAVLGNGGSARTLAFTLALLTKARRVCLVARDADKSHALIHEIKTKVGNAAADVEMDAVPLAGYADVRGDFDIVVNATPIGMHPQIEESLLPAEWLEPRQTVYDIVYNPEETALLRNARARGCATVGGLGMLVHQGIESFKLWTGLDPDPALFYEGIRRQQAAAAGKKP